MSVTSIARKDHHPPGRAPLAEAIARAAEAKSQVTAIKDAIERAERLAWASRTKVEAARKAVTTAKAEDAEALADSLVQGAGTTPLQTTRRAREEEIEAVDALEASRAAVSRLETDLQEAQHAAKRAGKGVRAIISALLKPVAERMREEASSLRVQYLTRMYAVAAMAEQLDGISYLRFDIGEAEHRQLRATISQSWLDAIDALARDSSAAIPSLDKMTTTPPRVA